MKNKPVIQTYRSYVQLIVLLGVIALLLWTVMKVFQQSDDQAVLIDNQGYVLEDVLASVERHMNISDDVPLMALIDNADSLKQDQKFYSNAQNGDILLIFASQAIIYRPETDVIVNVGPVIFNQK